jgi:hypothetical protein
MGVDVLPNSLARDPKDRFFDGAGNEWTPYFCANCGKRGGSVMAKDYNFAFWQCQPCFEKWGDIAGTYAIPDEVFWAKLNAAQIEEFGRILEPWEQVEALKDEHHIITKLARERDISGRRQPL